MSGVFYPIGTRVKLASGSCEMLVVDVIPNEEKAVVSWNYGGVVREDILPTVCLDLVRDRYVVDESGRWYRDD